MIKRIINATILGTLGFIFVFDTIVYLIGNDTISEQITGWYHAGNQPFFWAIVALLISHFVFGRYKD